MEKIDNVKLLRDLLKLANSEVIYVFKKLEQNLLLYKNIICMFFYDKRNKMNKKMYFLF